MNDFSAFIRRVSFFAITATPMFLLVAPACSTAGDLCDLICDCQKCNDRALDNCEIGVDALIDASDAYGCNDDADTATQCVIDNNDCNNNNFQISNKCLDDLQDLSRCIGDEGKVATVFVSIPLPQQDDTPQP